jgi:hypothetical protein
MKREELKALGIADEIIDSVMKIHGQDIEAHKAKVTDLENQAKTLTDNIKERDTQLEGLKTASGDAEGLKSQIAALQEANTKQAQEAATKLKDIQVNSAIKMALNGKVHDADLVASLFNKDKLVVNDDGTIIGLDDQVNTLKTSKSFLFVPEGAEGGTPPGFKVGTPPAEVGNPAVDAAIAAAFGNTTK